MRATRERARARFVSGAIASATATAVSFAQPSGKLVTVFFAGIDDLPTTVSGNTFETEWPPRSGRRERSRRRTRSTPPSRSTAAAGW